MNYKAMFEAVEGKLSSELIVYKKIRSDYEKKELKTDYLNIHIEAIEDVIKFTEELRRLYA